MVNLKLDLILKCFYKLVFFKVLGVRGYFFLCIKIFFDVYKIFLVKFTSSDLKWLRPLYIYLLTASNIYDEALCEKS